ncbi:S-adenosyl-L-methionine-dependent methyltransferase [Mycena pura]|uniref:S-adenosyl-L-methionine-dependent methyltransferase n=1 Tax=Mycena pura TaxID=153505 RepID=A0AAD6V285_9AGAR|nr:S-adenosyl-L-methionine-dependent methyltransferase [Mycena pura]
MATDTPANNESLYVVPAVSAEKDRLLKQYTMKNAVYGWTKPVPDIIDLSSTRNVLDIGAGTCIWSIDLANTPEVKVRRSEVNIYACDINPAILPPTVTAELGIKTFEQDVTKPFPTEYHGIFDLVHLSFLFICLTEDGWNKALENVCTLLSPGGLVMMDELDPVFFKEGKYERSATGYDLGKSMTGESWIHKLNSLYTGFIVGNKFLVGLTFLLPDMLERAGLRVVSSDVRMGGIGKVVGSLTGADGSSLAPYVDSSIENMEFILSQFVPIMRKMGTLEVPPGTRVVAEEDIESILAEVKEGLRTEGATCVGAFFVAKKI